MSQPTIAARRFVVAGAACLAFSAAIVLPGSAAMMRGGMKDRIVDSVANTMVSSIQSDSCADFAAMLKNRKGSSSSKSSQASGMMKNDPEARQRFVNKVAGPLLNKMIDCDLLPGH